MLRDGTALSTAQPPRYPPPASRLGYTPAEVAGLLGKHPKTVRDWCKRGLLASKRLGHTIYIPPRVLAGLLDEEVSL
jgi:hypothetical protein